MPVNLPAGPAPSRSRMLDVVLGKLAIRFATPAWRRGLAVAIAASLIAGAAALAVDTSDDGADELSRGSTSTSTTARDGGRSATPTSAPAPASTGTAPNG